MVLFISGFLFLQWIFLWVLLFQSKKSVTDEEQFLEDNLQMEYLRRYYNLRL